jgi:hypothetical protein
VRPGKPSADLLALPGQRLRAMLRQVLREKPENKAAEAHLEASKNLAVFAGL